jgi:MoaA/NifB/PqqE/SkfB family radical SAM enzyme
MGLNSLVKFITPERRRNIINSFPFRLFERIKLHNHEIQINAELTTRCNIACPMCSRAGLIKQGNLTVGDMPPELVDSIVSKIKSLSAEGKKIRFVPMGLGEPLMYKDLFPLFKKIRAIARDINIDLVTNGTLLDDRVVKDIFETDIDSVSVSLNTTSYNTVVDNISHLIIKRNESARSKPSVYVQYLDFNNDQTAIKQSMETWMPIMRGGDKCFVHPIVNHGGFCGKAGEIPKFPCSQPLYNLAIRINGDAYPCCSCLYAGNQHIPSLYIGNIKDDISYPAYFVPRLIIERMKKGDYSALPICRVCDTYKIGCNYYFKWGKRWI